MARVRAHTASSHRPTGADEDLRLDHLVVMCESSDSNCLLMQGMIHQTLAQVAHLPGAAELRAAGMDVFTKPESYGGHRWRAGKTNFVLLGRENVAYLYAMGSAAKMDLSDGNAFVRELVKKIEEFRPREVTAVAFARFMRKAEHGGELLRALVNHVGSLHCESDIDPTSESGSTMIQMLSMLASSERDAIVRRHTAGRVNEFLRGDWMLRAYPPGYRLVGKKLELDLDSVDAVRSMLVHLADETKTPKQLAYELGALGISTPKIEEMHGEDATVADARHPSFLIKTLCSWVDLYEFGEYEVLWRNPFAAMDDIAGVDVDRTVDPTEFPHGALRFPCRVPMPEAGWGSDATFAGIRRRLASKSATGGAATAARPPLSCVFDFSDGEFEYTLRADRSYYIWMRRPVDPQRRFSGWRSAQTDIEVIGRVPRDDLHRSIGETIALAAEEGLPASLDVARTMSLDGVRSVDPSEARLRVLKRRRDEVERLRNNAVRNANGADAADAAAVFLESVESLTREGVQLAKEIAALEASAKRPELTESFESAASMVAAALGALVHAGNSGEASLQQSLNAIFDGGRIMLEPDGGLRWSLCFDVPHPDGVVTLGPVTAVVPNHARPRQNQRTRAKHARAGAIDRLVDRGLLRSAAAAAAACPNPELEAALHAYLDSDVPEDEHDAWVVHVGRVYASAEFKWDRGKWALIDDVRRDVLAALVEGGGARPMSELQSLGFARTQIKYLSQALDTPTGAPIIRASGKAKTRVVRLIECPHCPGGTGHASVSVVTPETRPGVLCPDCRRLPTKDSPVFPEWYLATGELLGDV